MMREPQEFVVEEPRYGGYCVVRGDVPHAADQFVRFALPGERIEVVAVGNGDEVKLLKVLAAAEKRVMPACAHFGVCGGCDYQHAAYDEQLRMKRTILSGLLQHAGVKDVPQIATHAGEPYGYRNRIRLRLERAGGTLRFGYNERGSTRFLPIVECPIAAPQLLEAAEAMVAAAAVDRDVAFWLDAAGEVELFCNRDLGGVRVFPGEVAEGSRRLGRGGVEKQIPKGMTERNASAKTNASASASASASANANANASASAKTNANLNASANAHAEVSASAEVEENTEPGAIGILAVAMQVQVTLHCAPRTKSLPGSFARAFAALQAAAPQGVVVVGAGAIASDERTGPTGRVLADAGSPGLAYRVLEESYWITRGGFFQVNRFLVGALVELVTAGRSGALAWDLYAGVGLFSRVLARHFQQVVAVEANAAASADNRAALAKISSAHTAVAATTLEFLQGAVLQRERPELVVLDPPRAGVGVQACELLARIGPQTMVYVSCDPNTLARDLAALQARYRVRAVELVDLFPQTFHMETVVVLEREGG